MNQNKTFFLLTKNELELLKSILYLEPGLIESIEDARKEGSLYIIGLCPYDVNDALGALFFAAGYAESYTEKDKYLKLYDKIKYGAIRNKRLSQSS